MMRILLFAVLVMGCTKSYAQADTVNWPAPDTSHLALKEVVVIAESGGAHGKSNVLASLDSYLESSSQLNMIKRGAYAWEVFLNGMPSERSVVTIDGMRIYGACTDKMDPVSAYVEITNLSKAEVKSGQAGAIHGATVAGSVDLVRRKPAFSNISKWSGTVFSGLETNNMQKIAGAGLVHQSPLFFANADFTYRDANNYKAGGGREILYSPFTKYNISAAAGYKLSSHQQLEASVIYDRAINVGYPALPMDVALAKALMGSVEYTRHHLSDKIDQWQTKVYYNDITHIMDDSKRPVVPVRMDMPGWSKTAGFYSALNGTARRHQWKLNINGHQNRSIAEMTMFPSDPSEKEMYMLTWPGAHTGYAGIFAEDEYRLALQWRWTNSISAAVHHNNIRNELGLSSMRIFYPDLPASKARLLKSIATAISYDAQKWKCSFGAGYGERAPSVSEGYGFYLFNSFDRFDYIGNPMMKNERSLDANVQCLYRNDEAFSAKFTGNIFHIKNYIIGQPHSDLVPMTIGANGVKIYEQLKYANLLNCALDLDYQLSTQWLATGKLSYRRGVTDHSENLPFIQPLSYDTNLRYSRKQFFADIKMQGAVKQVKYGAAFGETAANAFTVFDISASQQVKLGKARLIIKTGVENLLDRYYTTFADWNRIPRMGRNVFGNVIVQW